MPTSASADAGAPPSVPLSFSNNFWGRDDVGVDPLLSRMAAAKTTCDELKAFYKARSELEEEYSKKLFAIARKPLGSAETGTLRASLDVARGETEVMGKQHALIAQQMRSELDEPLGAFAGGMKERRKIVQAGIERLLKTKQGQTAMVNKTRDKYEQDCLRIKGYLAQGHMVMGQEERKNKAKLEKTQINMASNSQEYEAAIKVLEETTGRWNKEWKSACDKFQDLEEERLDFTKSSLWAFANIASTVCVSDDASCEKVRLSLENCEVEKDIMGFIKTFGTGQEIPDPPRYINFCRGDIDSASEVSDDDNYSVAQFSRITNPAFRTSSPVHASPETDRSQRASEEPVEEIDVSTPTVANSGRPAPLKYKQPEPNVPPNYSPSQHGEIAKVPHNEYPTDGMTMYCRTNGNSVNGSALSSNTRPPSPDDLHSEYSNPSSFTSAEPMSGKNSPTKPPPVNGVGMPGMTGGPSPEKALQKKRSGFLSNSPFNSPFRRKSKKGLNENTNRASWNISTPNVNYNGSNISTSSTQSSPTKVAVRQSPFNRNAGRMAPEGEEPADPRASFQLNIGQNVLDVSNPDSHQSTPRASVNNRRGHNFGSTPLLGPSDEHDPIARALADLKQSSHGAGTGMAKPASTRQPVDNYHRVKTPAPDHPPAIRPGSTQDMVVAARGTPPPAYEGGASQRRAESALGVPRPAFTSKDMRSRTENWGNGSSVSAPVGRPGSSMGMASRPASRDGRRSPAPPGTVPRAVSPQPQPQYNRNGARSPGPGHDGQMMRSHPQNHSHSQSHGYSHSQPQSQPHSQAPPPSSFRSASPNPYAAGSGGQRSRANSQVRPQPQPQPGSRQTSGMEMQLAHPRQSSSSNTPRYDAGSGGSARSRTGTMNTPPSNNQRSGPAPRPASSYGGEQYQSQRGGGGGNISGNGGHESHSARGRQQTMDMELRRERSKSIAAPMSTNYSNGGGQIVPAGRTAPLHYARAMYTYAAAIPEELSFTKGDILAVLRMQDDGWWEAEVSRSSKGGNVGVGGAGLVPSNYLQRC